MRILYIIGNGFDKAHGLNTDYRGFREYLQNNHPDFLYSFEKLYGFIPLDPTEYGYSKKLQEKWDASVLNSLWSEFEKDMATPDIADMIAFSESVVDSMNLESGNIGIQDTMDQYWRKEYGFINQLQSYIKEWISQIDISNVVPMQQNLVNNEDDCFFSFNYTAILEEVYGVPHVMHIHGSIVDDFDGDPIIGHCNREEIQNRRAMSRKAKEIFDEGDASIQAAIADYLEAIYKDTAFLININQRFFRKLHDVNRVMIIGWSAGAVDIPYLREIRDSIHPNTKWTVYYYAENDTDRKAYDSLWAAFENCGIHEQSEVNFVDSKYFWDQEIIRH